MSPRTYQAHTPLEALLVEQALLLARQLQTVADDAPDGHVLRAVETFAVPAGRELTRKAVEATLQAQAEGVEKGATDPRLSGLRVAHPEQGARRAERPECGRGRSRPPPVPGLPAVLGVRLPARPASDYPLDRRLGIDGFVSPMAQRLLCLAGASWSFDRASANLKEFCGLAVCDGTIRGVCHDHGGAMRSWQRDDRAAGEAFRAASGDVEFQTDGTMVNTTGGWREMRLSIFAKRGRGASASGRADWDRRDLPAPHARVIQAGIRTGEQLGPGWWRMAVRLGLSDTARITVLADGAKWIWNQVAEHLGGARGVLDIYHASEHLWSAANRQFGDGTAQARVWVRDRRETLLRHGASGLLTELVGVEWSGVRGYFEPHVDHTDYADRLGSGRSIGSGLVEGACKQVVGRRLKQTGARWKVRRVDRMATLCAIQATEQWGAYWRETT